MNITDTEKNELLYIKCFFFFLAFLLLCSSIYINAFADYYMPWEYAMWRTTDEISRSEQQKSVELIVIGDSRAKAAYNPSQNKLYTSINLSLGGASPVIGFYTLERYLRAHPPPKKLLLSYSPSILSTRSGGAYWGRAVKFHYLSFSEHLAIVDTAEKIKDLKFKDGNPYWKYVQSFSPFASMPELRSGKLWQRKLMHDDIQKYVMLNGGHVFFGIDKQSSELNEEASYGAVAEMSPLSLHYIDKMIELASQKGMQVYWYAMPFNQPSCDAISNDMLGPYFDFLRSIEQDHVTILQKKECLSPQHFGDRSHTNQQGANYTTERLIGQILSGSND